MSCMVIELTIAVCAVTVLVAVCVVIGTWSPICNRAVLLSRTISEGVEMTLTRVIAFNALSVDAMLAALTA